MKTKICSKCKQEKFAKKDFHKDSKRLDGLNSFCKECRGKYYTGNKVRYAERSIKSYWNNREKRLKYNKEYNRKNKDKIKEWYERNKEKIKQYQKEYRQKNKERISLYRKERYLRNKEAKNN